MSDKRRGHYCAWSPDPALGGEASVSSTDRPIISFSPEPRPLMVALHISPPDAVPGPEQVLNTSHLN